MNDGGPAFPRRLPDVRVPPDEALRIVREHAGMSLRDYFAAHFQPSEADRDYANRHAHPGAVLARLAYDHADAMLEARATPA